MDGGREGRERESEREMRWRIIYYTRIKITINRSERVRCWW